jgi:hypothetical protein
MRTEIETCDRCGKNRPPNPERFQLVVSDRTDATADYETLYLCVGCWRQQRDDIREVLA